MRLLSTLAFWICATAGANPLILEPVYLTSEQLTVKFSPEAAVLKGTFTFRAFARVAFAEGHLAELCVPVWLPDDQTKHPPAPSLEIGGRKPKLWREPLWMSRGLTQWFIGVGLPEPGFRVWVCKFRLPYRLVENEVPVTITYTQPLRRSEGDRQFYYLPIIRPMKRESLTVDTNRFSITLATGPDCSLAVTNGQQEHAVAAGHSITLTPEDRQPIRATLKHNSNKTVRRTGASRLAQPERRTSSAAGSRR